MKKILIISSKYLPEYSGSGLRAHRTYKRLKEKFGIDFDVLTSSVEFNNIKSYKVEGSSVFRISMKIFRIAGFGGGIEEDRISVLERIKLKLNYIVEFFVTFLYLLFNIKKYRLFHIFGNNNVTSAGITFAKLFKIPLILEVTMDTDSLYQREIFPLNLILKRLPNKNVIVCISERLRRRCINMGYEYKNIWCRPNPVDERKFFVEKNKKFFYRKKLLGNFNLYDILLFNNSKFIPRKNQIFLIDVMKFLPDKFKLLLTGPIVDSGPLFNRDRDYYNQILNKIENNALQDRVEIRLGFIENVDEYYKMSDVFLFPSYSEGLGTPILESIACGVPVVANKIKGITDWIIREGESGYLSELVPEEFALKIKKAINISEENLKLESQRILENFSTENIDRKYYEIIERLVRNE